MKGFEPTVAGQNGLTRRTLGLVFKMAYFTDRMVNSVGKIAYSVDRMAYFVFRRLAALPILDIR
jgi:hypothetical protein